MTLSDDNGFSIELLFDDDGFPLISINTGGGFMAADFRPTVDIELNGVGIFPMFDEHDHRWSEHGSSNLENQS